MAEIQQNYSNFQSDLQALASKIGELEQEAEEHRHASPLLSQDVPADPFLSQSSAIYAQRSTRPGT